jgi:hypothetical protein
MINGHFHRSNVSFGGSKLMEGRPTPEKPGFPETENPAEEDLSGMRLAADRQSSHPWELYDFFSVYLSEIRATQASMQGFNCAL